MVRVQPGYLAGSVEIAPMGVRLDFSALRKTKWHDYAIRFVFGGAVSLIAGLLAMRFGPVLGGLFLASPAIFPASVTLVEKHETEKKQRAGIGATSRGRQAAAVESHGTAIGSVGLACFGLTIWLWLPGQNAALVFLAAIAVWFGTNVLLWRFRKAKQLSRLFLNKFKTAA